jgi:hypothetical protein
MEFWIPAMRAAFGLLLIPILAHAQGSDTPSLCTDRPTRSTLPCVVPEGMFQYEADIGNWTPGTTLYGNPTIKYGLGHGIDLEASLAPLETVGKHTGIGDLYIRAKYAVVNESSFQITLSPYIKLPTAASGIGNGFIEGGLIMPVSFNLPGSFTLLFDPEVDVYHTGASIQGLVNLSRPITDTVTAYIEYWQQGNERSIDFAISWLLLPNLQLDVGVNIGASPTTPHEQIYFGVSQRF